MYNIYILCILHSLIKRIIREECFCMRVFVKKKVKMVFICSVKIWAFERWILNEQVGGESKRDVLRIVCFVLKNNETSNIVILYQVVCIIFIRWCIHLCISFYVYEYI